MYEAVRADADQLSYSQLSVWENGSDQICMSLQLPQVGPCGSQISWQSSNPQVITHGGRVIRPRWYEADATVTMSATITKGEAKAVREFSFTVRKDEPWEDSQFLPDAEFFGVYDGIQWTEPGMLDYSLSGLTPVCEAVKKGDYTLAKEALQKYYAGRKPMSRIDPKERNTLWANALVDDFYHLQSGAYFQGEMQISSEWGRCEATIGLINIARGGISCFGVRSWYNECSWAEIRRYQDEDAACRPWIELVVNGRKRVYPAMEDTMARAGAYKDCNYYREEVLRAQTFGPFLGDDTWHAFLKFDFTDLKADDQITSAKLVLTARVCPSFVGAKRLLITKEPVNTWDGSTAVWKDFGGYVYSYNGLPGKNDWVRNPEGSDIEYWYQMCRFYGYPNAILPEYLATGDETYMYKMLAILNDYLRDTGNYTMCDTIHFDPNGVRGGFTRSLDAAIKNFAFIKMVEVIAQSPSTTPELFTAFLKSIRDTTNYLTIHHTGYNNWRQTEFQAVLEASIKMPEFYDALHGVNWREIAVKELEDMLFLNNLPDGSYREATCGYSFGAFEEYVKHKICMKEMGIEVSEEYNRLLHKCAYYITLLLTPNGRNLQYGDNAAGSTGLKIMEQICDWFDDRELKYIISRGAEGTRPSWTSRHWSDSTVTVMQADWTAESPYLFTNVRGGGTHGHRDYNGVIMYAYGRMLLNDAGIFTYTSTDPYRRWGTSTVAHNTVVINDGSQIHVESAGLEPTGHVYDWKTEASFDYLSQSTPNYPGFEHRRSILFVKPNLWIISDRIISEESETVNNYKQVWHMLPSAGLTVSQEDRTIYSTYAEGANVIIANADDEAELHTAMGYYDQSYQQLQKAPYGYFEKTVSGPAGFDTVILAVKDDPSARVTCRKLETDGDACALQIDYVLNGEAHTGYCYIAGTSGKGCFGRFQTDARVVYLEEDGHRSDIRY